MKQPRQKSYRTKRLELREFRASDWKVWVQAQERRLPKQDEWDQSATPVTRRRQSHFKRQLLAQKKHFKKNGIYLWAIFLKKTGEFVGWIDISTINREPYSIANLGWFTINIYRGQGYAKEATLKLISAAFSDLRFHRLEASIDPRNKPSIKMAEACGLTFEALKKHYLKVDGAWRDHVCYVTTPELFYDRS